VKCAGNGTSGLLGKLCNLLPEAGAKGDGRDASCLGPGAEGIACAGFGVDDLLDAGLGVSSLGVER
jgi:hypothetical protein